MPGLLAIFRRRRPGVVHRHRLRRLRRVLVRLCLQVELDHLRLRMPALAERKLDRRDGPALGSWVELDAATV